MISDVLKTEKGRLLFNHLHSCQKCYNEWHKIAGTVPQDKTVKRIEEIVDSLHPGDSI